MAQNGARKNRDQEKMLRDFGLLSLIVTDLLGYTGAGIAIGWFAWKKWAAPTFLIPILALVGLTLAMYKVFQLTRKDWDKNAK